MFKAAADAIRIASQISRVPQCALPIVFDESLQTANGPVKTEKRGELHTRAVASARGPPVSKRARAGPVS